MALWVARRHATLISENAWMKENTVLLEEIHEAGGSIQIPPAFFTKPRRPKEFSVLTRGVFWFLGVPPPPPTALPLPETRK